MPGKKSTREATGNPDLDVYEKVEYDRDLSFLAQRLDDSDKELWLIRLPNDVRC